MVLKIVKVLVAANSKDNNRPGAGEVWYLYHLYTLREYVIFSLEQATKNCCAQAREHHDIALCRSVMRL